MSKNVVKLSIAAIIFSGVVLSSLDRTKAYPAFLRQAVKYGAKNCLFCHKNPEGGEGWNERGQWLIAEKERRKADTIDVAWLADYKEQEKKEGDKPETGSEKKEEPKKKEKP